MLYWRALSGRRLAGELNGLVPEILIRPVLFQDDPLSTPDHKTDESANATHEYWLTYMPEMGFIHVDSNSDHILPPPMVDEVNGIESYFIAVFHQLHCLVSVNQSRASRGIPPRDADHQHDPVAHIDHCFRYLRQSLVCCGDTALEGQNPKAKVPDTDGTGAVHLCKDFDIVKVWA
ncbi:hypothetical protein N658DRAFT_455131 [Parathielavia hyrcaniae]|uniref:Uncharacterized protein n=1 Tax=Parathielavia hyrcaniae TaxID=113614 RepID=A0AAN6PYF1_9PEZI|nr:hypothetical protein N658DRAFT_455131 [Parathielavia hyrcaniae]